MTEEVTNPFCINSLTYAEVDITMTLPLHPLSYSQENWGWYKCMSKALWKMKFKNKFILVQNIFWNPFMVSS